MDVDMFIEDIGQSSTAATGKSNASARKPRTVPVDDAHPFDLEAYIANYEGRTVVERLAHIISGCPDLAADALQLAVKHIRNSRDPSQYQTILNAYEPLSNIPGVELPPAMEIAPLDVGWVEEVTNTNQADKSKLEVELRNYSSNMIKESIRMAYRDLGDFYHATGDLSAAYKNHTKCREFCTTSQQVLDVSLTVLALLIEQRNYSHIQTYIYKAESAIEAATMTASKERDKDGNNGGNSKKTGASADRDRVQTMLDFAAGMSQLGQGNYEKAASAFVRLGPPKQLGDWIGKLVSPGDIAIYGTLCALSSFSRSAIKSALLNSDNFGAYIEHEPHIRELIEAYMASNFKTVLDILNRYSTRHFLDIHIAPHVYDLTSRIRSWAVVLYFQPFSTIKLDRMSQAFGWSLDEIEREVVMLIQSGEINARVDSQNKVLVATKTDPRVELFNKALAVGENLKVANRKLLYRMRLQQADLVVKAPKQQQQQQQQHSLQGSSQQRSEHYLVD